MLKYSITIVLRPRITIIAMITIHIYLRYFTTYFTVYKTCKPLIFLATYYWREIRKLKVLPR